MTTQVRRVLQNWIKNFGRKGLLKVEGENVRSIYNAGKCIITRLHEVNALPGDADVDILHGLTLATNKTFTAPFFNSRGPPQPNNHLSWVLKYQDHLQKVHRVLDPSS